MALRKHKQVITHTFMENLSLLQAQKLLKFEFAVEAMIIFVKNIKKGIKWYVHFVGKAII